jgi:hypothetical protein
MKVFLVCFVALSAIALSESSCPAGFEGSNMKLCAGRPKWVKAGGGKVKDWSALTCDITEISHQECITLSKSFDSGYSMDDRTCNVYVRDDCRGNSVSVDKWGWFKFPKGAIKSFRCPCRKSAAAAAPALGG